MKKTSLLVLCLLVTFGINYSNAQDSSSAIKVGHTNARYIVSQLPETKNAQAQLETVKTQLEKVIQEKTQTFQEKAERYRTSSASMSEALLQSTEAELQKLRTEVEELQTKSEQTYMEKQQALFKPLIDKVNKAIAEVGKEQGYMYIISSDTGTVGNPVLLYSGSEETDITNLVLKKLGITVSK